jgi:4-hydroxy-tetrahydrodipicolinate synthase
VKDHLSALNRLGVAIVTPFLASGEIDWNALEQLTDHIISNGVSFIVVLGTTGETPTLSLQERLDVISAVQSANASRVPIVIGCGSNDTSALVEMASLYVHRFQPDALMSVAPFYNKPTQTGLIQHFGALARAVETPILLYNVPGRTACPIAPETVLMLSESHPNIIGIKESTGSVEAHIRLHQLFSARQASGQFFLVGGDDFFCLSSAVLGFPGLISVIANAFPAEMVALHQALMANNIPEARTLFYRIYSIIQLAFEEGSPSGIKFMLSLKGLCSETVRLPLVPISPTLQQKIEKELYAFNQE